MHDEYIKATELLAVELDREPTSEEIDEKMVDMEAKRIDDIFEQRQQAKMRMGVSERMPKGTQTMNQKEAIGFREKVKNRLPSFLPDSYEGMKSVCAALTDLLHEACDIADASEAKEPPLASDFTKDCITKYICYWNGTCRWDSGCGKAFKEACTIIDRSESSRKELLEELEKINQCFKCKYGYRTTEITCPGYADAELPCAGFEEAYDGSVAIEAAITKAKKEGKRE